MQPFEADLLAGNSRGTGFVKIPKAFEEIAVGQRVRVSFQEPYQVNFFAKIVRSRGGIGVYVPKNLTADLAKINSKLSVKIDETTGFYSKVMADGRITIPKSVVDEKQLSVGDAIALTNKEKIKYSQVWGRKKAGAYEFSCAFYPEYAGITEQFDIERLKGTKNTNFLTGLKTFLVRERTIVFDGGKRPVLVNSDLCPEEFTHYLGAYFADGTKIGNNWGICASTLEQGKYYLECHASIILEPRTVFEVSYTGSENKCELPGAEAPSVVAV